MAARPSTRLLPLLQTLRPGDCQAVRFNFRSLCFNYNVVLAMEGARRPAAPPGTSSERSVRWTLLDAG